MVSFTQELLRVRSIKHASTLVACLACGAENAASAAVVWIGIGIDDFTEADGFDIVRNIGAGTFQAVFPDVTENVASTAVVGIIVGIDDKSAAEKLIIFMDGVRIAVSVVAVFTPVAVVSTGAAVCRVFENGNFSAVAKCVHIMGGTGAAAVITVFIGRTRIAA